MAKMSLGQAVAKAEQFERKGNFKKAAEGYAAVLKSGSKNPEARNGFLRCVGQFNRPQLDRIELEAKIRELASLLRSGEFHKADKQCLPLIKSFPNNVLLLNISGVAQIGLGRANMAIETLNLAIGLKPDYADAHQNLGLALQKLGDSQGALAAFEEAVRINPLFSKAHDNIGSMQQVFRQYDLAIEAHERALEITPKSTDARRNLAIAFRDNKQNNEALAEFNTLLEMGVRDAQTFFEIGALLRKMERPIEAIDALDETLTIDPEFVEALILKGHCYKTMAEPEKAAECYRQAISIKPNSARAYFGLSSVSKLTNSDEDIAKMHALLDDRSLSDDDLSQLNFALAYAYNHRSDWETSFKLLTTANSIRKKALGYDIANDVALFASLKSNEKLRDAIIDQNRMSKFDVTPIFIVGMPRSGTTLTEQIICSHPDVQGAGELHFAAKFGLELANGTKEPTDENLEAFRNSYLSSLTSLANGHKFVTDKMPHNFRLLGVIATAIPEAKIVHVQRDPAATCWSNFYLSFRTTGLGYSYDLEDLVKHYALYKDLMRHWSELFPSRIVELNYESLTQDQSSETMNLIEALELKWDDACLSPEKNERTVLTASNSQVKKGVYTGSSQKWKRFEPFMNGVFDSLTN